jgi:hypothetical protein
MIVRAGDVLVREYSELSVAGQEYSYYRVEGGVFDETYNWV